MNVTLKQIITLLLMVATMALILSLLPEQAKDTAGPQVSAGLIEQAAK